MGAVCPFLSTVIRDRKSWLDKQNHIQGTQGSGQGQETLSDAGISLRLLRPVAAFAKAELVLTPLPQPGVLEQPEQLLWPAETGRDPCLLRVPCAGVQHQLQKASWHMQNLDMLLIALEAHHVITVPCPNQAGVFLPSADGEVGAAPTQDAFVRVTLSVSVSFHSRASLVHTAAGEGFPTLGLSNAGGMWMRKLGRFWSGVSIHFSGCLLQTHSSSPPHTFLVELPGTWRLSREESTVLLVRISCVSSLWMSAVHAQCWKCQEMRPRNARPARSPGIYAH